jgi:hypothetical protein
MPATSSVTRYLLLLTPLSELWRAVHHAVFERTGEQSTGRRTMKREARSRPANAGRTQSYAAAKSNRPA